MQKSRYGIGCAYVENALDLTDVDAELQRDRRASNTVFFGLQLLLGFFADGGGKAGA